MNGSTSITVPDIPRLVFHVSGFLVSMPRASCLGPRLRGKGQLPQYHCCVQKMPRNLQFHRSTIKKCIYAYSYIMLYIYRGRERVIYIYIIYYEGTSRRSCFESVKRVHFPGPQEAMLTACAAAFTAYVRKLFFVHLGRTCTCCRASRPRALDYTIVYGQSAKRDVI